MSALRGKSGRILKLMDWKERKVGPSVFGMIQDSLEASIERREKTNASVSQQSPAAEEHLPLQHKSL